MSRTIVRPSEYVNPLGRMSAAIRDFDPSGDTLGEALAALNALAAEWNAMYEVVYAAGEWCESRSEADRAALVTAFATWKNWVERAIPMGAWVVAEPEPTPGQWPAARDEDSWASDDDEVSF